MKIAVIGAGVFGAEISLKLASEGHDVHLFEKDFEILKGATAGSQNRLHMGLHYPRDLQTAIQSRVGYFKFKDRFSEAIREDFPSYYAISSMNSKVNSTEFEDFATSAGIQLLKLEKGHINLPINYKLIDQIYLTQEGVIDLDELRRIFNRELNESNVTLHLNSKVMCVMKANKSQFFVESSGGSDTFKIVVIATYVDDEIKVEKNLRNFEYQQTLVLSIKTDLKPAAYTVMDGDFLTLLPHGFTSNFLIYGPSLSTLSKHTGSTPPSKWGREDLPKMAIALAREQLIGRTRQYFPELTEIEVLEELSAIRSIDPMVRSTDQRISRVTETDSGFFEVWSGKIDHCVTVSEQISDILDSRRHTN
jgi:glycine/D-amino acid oxidase-like deaminating enzyme